MTKCTSTLLAVMAALISASASGQSFPSKPVHLVVPYAAGGGADTLARSLAQRMSSQWSQPVVVENRAGANTAIGSVYVAKSAPDGYTLLMIETALVINPSLYSKLPYDPFRDFAPVAGLVAINQALVVNAALPARDLKDIISLAKAKPGALTYASFGLGSTAHLNMEMLQQMAGIQMTHVQYKGTAPAMIDVISGQVNMMFTSTGGALPHWKSGKVRMVAIGSKARLPQFPDVPTVIEAGLPGYEATAWFGLVAPAATPRQVIGVINGVVQKAFADPAFREKSITPQAFEPIAGSPEQFGAYMRSEAEKWERVARNSKVKLD